MPGVGLYSDVIMEVTEKYELGEYTDDEVLAAIALLEQALEDCKKSEILPGKDITYILKNPSFEDQSTQPGGDSGGVADAPKGWDLVLNGDTCKTAGDMSAHGIANWCAINSGDAISVTLEDGTVVERQPTEGDKLWGIWTANMPEVEISQTLTGLPMGTYIMTADVMVQNNWAGDNITTQRLFANEYIQMFSTEIAHELNLPADAQDAAQRDIDFPEASIPFLTYAGYTCEADDRTTDLLHTMTVKFAVGEDGIAHFGFRTNNVNVEGISRDEGGRDGQGWFKLDNFTLYYESEEMPTAIKCIDVESNATVSASEYYTIGGLQTTGMQRGINIVKQVMSDGSIKVIKVLVK